MAQSRPFMQVDVFCRTAYSGNPVAVVGDASGVTDAEMQRVAAWTNLSETTFLLPPSDPGADYRVRIFTASAELPFAGHPTLGSAHAWLSLYGGEKEAVVQQSAAGLVRVRRAPCGLAFEAPPLARGGPVEPAIVDRAAGMLNIAREEVIDARWADNGPGWLAVMLDDAGSVLALRPGPMDLPIGAVGMYPAGSDFAYEVRAFLPGRHGTPVEDPVTGSLNASLAQWLVPAGLARPPYVASQGGALGRQGEVHISQAADGAIWVGGRTLTCMAGEIVI